MKQAHPSPLADSTTGRGRMRRAAKCLARIALAVGLACAGAAAQAQYNGTQHGVQIWFAPKQSFVQRQPGGPALIDFNAYDFTQMLAPGAPWQQAAADTSLLSINLHTIERYDNLPGVIAMTQRYRFMIGTQGGLMYAGGGCMQGRHVEGVDSNATDYAHEIVKSVQRWKTAGGRLDYIIWDSPFFFGYYHIHNECNYSIDDVARRTAATFLEIRKFYPSIRIMDAEGPGPVPVSDWLRDFDEFLRDFRAAAGQPIDGVALDLHWTDDWHTGYEWVGAAQQSIQFLHAHGVMAALIVNAKDKLVSTPEEWMEQNRAVLRQAHDANLGMDAILISSWSKNPSFPSRNMPDSDPAAYASLVEYAARLFR